ncbi:MAG: DUF971 domain-containing protein [Candidatus Eisenbacteria bacterium]|nr:DUF971 domain-containing protein [Candidatus Eisenbacteria bacterium]
MPGAPSREKPVSIEKAGEETLRIVWEDGAVSDFNVAALRRACPCAGCVDEWSGKRKLDPLSVLESVRPIRIEPVGRYAIRIIWSDHHDTGIYSFTYLRSLADGKAPKEK